ncbi:F-box/kelch-repeat protein At3g23880 [Ziziphus jujuba]|uniref:F-box/kelch-repeat protein At3g23880 n=1 Tax=Ziziphus jujuba TaxID=326968 RepID=A0ABM3ZV33_ZIZJJ|nr:F-box/kelch-repeat protein At3g23880 [Ziziphus jujuba]
MPCDCKFMLLAEELVIQILLNLVVKDILRCKCVCKSWYYLITSPSFIDEHLKLSNRKDPYLLVDYRSTSQGAMKDRVDVLYPPTIILVSHETLEEVDRQVMLSSTSLVNMDLAMESYTLGCCYGILCILLGYFVMRVVLWNPATREAKVVPPTLYSCHPENSILYYTVMFGFGFDAKNNDYKVVAIQELRWKRHWKNGLPLYAVEVYSVRTNSWRLLPAGVLVRSFTPTGRIGRDVCIGGMYSWLLEGEEVILSFDMENNVFISTPLPSGINSIPVIMVYNESVAVAYIDNYECQPCNYELWMLGEYGVQESWTKQFNFRSMCKVNRSTLIFGIWNNSDIYLHATGPRELKLFESTTLWPATRRCKIFEPYGYLGGFIRNVISFKESLVPINKLDYEQSFQATQKSSFGFGRFIT